MTELLSLKACPFTFNSFIERNDILSSSWSGFYDELMLSSLLLYMATEDSSYITKARQAHADGNLEGEKAWALSWDDKRIAAQVSIICFIQNDRVGAT